MNRDSVWCIVGDRCVIGFLVVCSEWFVYRVYIRDREGVDDVVDGCVKVV